MKKDARKQAESVFLDAKGEISNVEIAKKVNVNPLTVGKWKRQDDWQAKLVAAQAAEARKTQRAVPRKKGAHDKALGLYQDVAGNITNKALADRVGVSAATIAGWKAAEGWADRLKEMPEPVTVEVAKVEEAVTAAEVEEVEVAPEAPIAEEMEEIEEIEIDVEALVCPDHFAQLNKCIGEMLERGCLSPTDIKTVAEAKEAVLRAAIAYMELWEMTGED